MNNDFSTLWRQLLCALCLWLVSWSSLAAQTDRANSIEQLIQQGKLEINAWVGESAKPIDKDEIVAVNQQLILTVEVATDRWFTGGTRIAPIEHPNLIAKQRNPLATNFTERRNGQTWSIQRWEITLYPQVSGTFQLAPVALKLKVNVDTGYDVEGVTYTKPLAFSAQLPSAKLTDQSAWFSATDAKLTQNIETSSQQLRVGDSITRNVELKTQDSLSIMLPKLIPAQNGSATEYSAPPQLGDTQSRGVYGATRSEQTTYIVQQGGSFELPAITLYQWDPIKDQLIELSVEGMSFEVKHTLQSWLKAYWKMLLVSGLSVAAVVMLLLMTRRYYQTHDKPLWWQFKEALSKQNWARAKRLYYVKREQQGTQRQTDTEQDLRDKTMLEPSPQKSALQSLWAKLKPVPSQTRSKFGLPAALPQLKKGHNGLD